MTSLAAAWGTAGARTEISGPQAEKEAREKSKLENISGAMETGTRHQIKLFFLFKQISLV